MAQKPLILSGIQPSGNLCIGNYVGALKNWVDLQHDYESLFLVVDLHALTVPQVPADLRKRCLSFVAQYVACGIDPQVSTIAMQSHIPQHAELAWILNSMTYMGELNRMTQFKEKSQKQGSEGNIGLFSYPVLMAADILIYQTDLVPVGADQKQHMELTRDLAQRFNQRYSPTFKIPEVFIPKVGARIMSLQDPTKKMSKSDSNANAYVALLDPPDVIARKIKRAVTDSGSEVVYDSARPGVCNLMQLFAVLTNKSIEQTQQHFEGKMYGHLKGELADVLIETLRPVQTRYDELMGDRAYLDELLSKGAETCRKKARKTLSKVYRKVGLVAPTR